MERNYNYLLTAIAALGILASFTPSANAQFRNYNRYSNYNNYNNSGDRIGTPGFSQPIFMPNRRNNYPYGYGYYKGNNRNYRGNDELTIINGGNNCINCRVDDWERRDNNWHHRRHRQKYFYY